MSFVHFLIFFLQLPSYGDLLRVRLGSTQEIALTGQIGSVQGDAEFKFLNSRFDRSDTQIKIWRRDGTWVIRSGAKDERLTGTFLHLRGQHLKWKGQSVPGDLLVSEHKGELQLVAFIDEDRYVGGVLAGEMPSDWPLETLKAQAVAARSYALAVAQGRLRSPWQLESSIADQVFRYDRFRGRG
ncbi:MAG: SpoIID/LytB domain-containing protein, partial [Bdellovibrionaceae bacterium]|nr:SpoIID/LytB domain-containing protein [Pseudobdellovibrionaceae bacterium]